MAGIIQQAQAPQKADPQVVQRLVIAAMKILHTPQLSQQFLTMMKQAGDPAKAIATVTILVMKQLVEKSKGLPSNAIVPAGIQVMKLVADLGATAKLFKVTPELMVQALQVVRQQMGPELKQQAQPAQVAPQAAAQPAQQPAVQPQGA